MRVHPFSSSTPATRSHWLPLDTKKRLFGALRLAPAGGSFITAFTTAAVSFRSRLSSIAASLRALRSSGPPGAASSSAGPVPPQQYESEFLASTFAPVKASTFVPVKQVYQRAGPRLAPRPRRLSSCLQHPLLRCQNLYFCTSTASKQTEFLSAAPTPQVSVFVLLY